MRPGMTALTCADVYTTLWTGTIAIQAYNNQMETTR